MGVIYSHASLLRHGLPNAEGLHLAATELVAVCEHLPIVSSMVVVGSVAEGRHDQWSDIDAVVWSPDPLACWDSVASTLQKHVAAEAYEVKVWPVDESLAARAARFSDLGFAQVIRDSFDTSLMHVGGVDDHTRALAEQYCGDAVERRQCLLRYLERRAAVAEGVQHGTVTWSLHEARRLLETPKAVQRQLVRVSEHLVGLLADAEPGSFAILSDMWDEVVAVQLAAAAGDLNPSEYQAAILRHRSELAAASSRICRGGVDLVCA